MTDHPTLPALLAAIDRLGATDAIEIASACYRAGLGQAEGGNPRSAEVLDEIAQLLAVRAERLRRQPRLAIIPGEATPATPASGAGRPRTPLRRLGAPTDPAAPTC